jgi:hypothetical protein
MRVMISIQRCVTCRVVSARFVPPPGGAVATHFHPLTEGCGEPPWQLHWTTRRVSGVAARTPSAFCRLTHLVTSLPQQRLAALEALLQQPQSLLSASPEVAAAATAAAKARGQPCPHPKPPPPRSKPPAGPLCGYPTVVSTPAPAHTLLRRTLPATDEASREAGPLFDTPTSGACACVAFPSGAVCYPPRGGHRVWRAGR